MGILMHLMALGAFWHGEIDAVEAKGYDSS